MANNKRTIADYIKDSEYYLAKYKAVQEIFPNARVSSYVEFSDKSVNQIYNKFVFENRWGLFVIPYYEFKFTYDGKDEMIKVYSQPRRNRLAYLTYRTDPVSKKRIMKFSRLAVNMKNNEFKEDMLNSCKAEIMNFIKNNPNYHLDTKHLEPRLKKLIMFT